MQPFVKRKLCYYFTYIFIGCKLKNITIKTACHCYDQSTQLNLHLQSSKSLICVLTASSKIYYKTLDFK